ncbi:MAG TPA: OmpA family protein [Usitatibacteraceae bacterium]|nr:OmpA family protein [Usitatibacteraceae bacterium]
MKFDAAQAAVAGRAATTAGVVPALRSEPLQCGGSNDPGASQPGPRMRERDLTMSIVMLAASLQTACVQIPPPGTLQSVDAAGTRRLAEESARSATTPACQALLLRKAREPAAADRNDAGQAAEVQARQSVFQRLGLEASRTSRGWVITFGDALFDEHEAKLLGDGVGTARQLAGFLALYPLTNLLIEGFTDSTGSRERDNNLSEDRARAVRALLLDRGIAGERIGMQGFGEAFPLASNDTLAGRHRNRRVEVIVADDCADVPPR